MDIKNFESILNDKIEEIGDLLKLSEPFLNDFWEKHCRAFGIPVTEVPIRFLNITSRLMRQGESIDSAMTNAFIKINKNVIMEHMIARSIECS